jgi:outer membrane protein OmpA-like peptidoglycan-associated protein
MKHLKNFILLVALLPAIQPVLGQTSASPYMSSIKSSEPQRHAYPTIIRKVAPTPYFSAQAAAENVDDATTMGEPAAEAVSEVVANARMANYVEFGSVGFYPNAAIMAESGRTLMNGLAAYLHENPHLKLRIHGHCNNNAPRTIITLGCSSDYFSMGPENALRQATAGELSELRAESARQFLVAQGISAERIQIIGEGGNHMIYPQTSLHAHYNDRIEFQLEPVNIIVGY